MSAREWKPGDVGWNESGGRVFVYRDSDSGQLRYRFDDDSGARPLSDIAGHMRPLVVIDPEDREQVERLIRLFCHHTPRGDAEFVLRHGGIDNMQAALREFADPKPPKPEEPLGIGAVIEDGDGRRYARIAVAGDALAHDHEWFVIGGSANAVRTFGYDQIDVVRVLSDGWVGEDR